jgi:3-hydroxyisobutyrate dehydrogenase
VKVGWIGTGEMGRPMCERLLAAGVDLVVWNRTRAKAEPLAEQGATVVDTLQELDADLVFVTVTGADDVAAVLEAPDGLFGGPRRPEVVVNCSTVTEDGSAALRRTAEAAGVAFVAAPISASASMIPQGTAAIVSSGPAEAFARVQPYLEQIAGTVVYAGEGETALLLKLCSNVLMGTFTQSLFELARVADRGGVDTEAFFAFVSGSPIGSVYARFKAQQFLAGQDQLAPHARSLMQRDFDDCLDAAREAGATTPLSEAARRLL